MNFQKWCDSFTSINFYNEYYEKYLKQFSNESIPLLDKLFEKIVFINEERLSELVEEFYNQTYVLCKDAVIISTILDNRTHNSYNASLKLLEKVNIINKPLLSDLNKNNVIIFDDYSGSGLTIIEALNYLKYQIHFKGHIYVFPLIITDYAYQNISKYILENNLSDFVTIKYINKHETKYLSNNFFDSSEISKILEISKFLNVNEKFIRGYNNTEDLFSFNYYTPNNTIGFLWSNGNILHIPFFKRKMKLFDLSRIKRISYEEHEFIKNMMQGKRKDKKYYYSILLRLLGFNEIETSRFLSIDLGTVDKYYKNMDDKKIFIDNKIGKAFFCFFDKKKYLSYVNLGIHDSSEHDIELNLTSLITRKI